MKQQAETLNYFRRHAEEWRAKAARQGAESINIIHQRNTCVMHCLADMSGAGSFLDVGCGSGELVLDVAEKLEAAVGIDFADTMIKECIASAKRAVLKMPVSRLLPHSSTMFRRERMTCCRRRASLNTSRRTS